MIAALMLYLSIFGTLIAAAAWCAEFVAIRVGVARRGIWMTSMLIMCGVPFAPADWTARWELPVGMSDARVDGDTTLRAIWILASLAMLLVTGMSTHRMIRMRRAWQLWKRDTFSRPTMWLSEHFGPAAFGVGRSEIVMPRWAMTLPSADRHLMLAHERAHVDAHDPRLLALGRILVIAMPWHLPLRWAYRRLQRAIEHDCDRRVLDSPKNARRYADLLLLVAERGIATPPLAMRALGLGGTATSMTSLLDGAPELESRLRFLIASEPTMRSRLSACAAAGVAALLVISACALPMPRRAALADPAREPASLASLALMRDPAWVVRSQSASWPSQRRSSVDSIVLARDDSLVIDAIAQSNPSLLMLASTPTPYVAIAINEANEVVSHSVRAGAPVRPLAQSVHHLVRESGASLIDASTHRNDDEFQGRLAVVANMPARYLDSLGISHLQVGDRALTVLWMRFKPRTGV